VGRFGRRAQPIRRSAGYYVNALISVSNSPKFRLAARLRPRLFAPSIQNNSGQPQRPAARAAL